MEATATQNKIHISELAPKTAIAAVKSQLTDLRADIDAKLNGLFDRNSPWK